MFVEVDLTLIKVIQDLSNKSEELFIFHKDYY